MWRVAGEYGSEYEKMMTKKEKTIIWLTDISRKDTVNEFLNDMINLFSNVIVLFSVTLLKEVTAKRWLLWSNSCLYSDFLDMAQGQMNGARSKYRRNSLVVNILLISRNYFIETGLKNQYFLSVAQEIKNEVLSDDRKIYSVVIFLSRQAC